MGNWNSSGVTLPPIEFDGDSITFVVSRLLMEDMLVIKKHIDVEKGVLRFNDPLELISLAKITLPKYIKSMSGLKDSAGVEVPLETFLTACLPEVYFSALVGQLFADLLSVSSARGLEKKSGALSPDS